MLQQSSEFEKRRVRKVNLYRKDLFHTNMDEPAKKVTENERVPEDHRLCQKFRRSFDAECKASAHASRPVICFGDDSLLRQRSQCGTSKPKCESASKQNEVSDSLQKETRKQRINIAPWSPRDLNINSNERGEQ